MDFVALIPYLSGEAKTEEYLRRGNVLSKSRMPLSKPCKFRGVSPEAFPLYIKELEAGSNSRGGDIFNIVLEILADKLRVKLS